MGADKNLCICAHLRNLKHQLPCEKRSAMKKSGCGSCRYAVTAPRLKVCAFAQCIPRSALWLKKSFQAPQSLANGGNLRWRVIKRREKEL